MLHLRKCHPLWGKPKIWKVLCRDHGFALSISTVAGILKHLLQSRRVRPVAFYYGRVKPKRQRQFKHHARRWRYGMRAKKPGELIQIDPMSVNFSEGFTLKEFKATGIEPAHTGAPQPIYAKLAADSHPGFRL